MFVIEKAKHNFSLDKWKRKHKFMSYVHCAAVWRVYNYVQCWSGGTVAVSQEIDSAERESDKESEQEQILTTG